MAKAFIGKEAKAYLGWSNLVETSIVDKETAKLIGRLLVEDKTFEEAVKEASPDSVFFNSSLGYYPESAGSLRLSDLINGAKDSETTLNPAVLNYCWNLALTVVYSSHKKLKDFK